MLKPRSHHRGGAEGGDGSDGSDREDERRDRDGISPDQSGGQYVTYITVETQDGRLDKLKVLMDDSDFATSHPIVRSLIENGEVTSTANGGGPGKQGTGAGGVGTSSNPDGERRGSIFRTLSRNTSSKTQSSALDIESQLDAGQLHQRQGSIITKDLIENLKKNKKRIIAKGGQCNLHVKNVSKKRRQFLRDMFTTAIDMEWRYTLLAFASSFFVSWTIFAIVYHVIGIIRGDFTEENLLLQDEGKYTPCVWALKDFTSSYLFSVETQHTIGYGTRQTTEACPEAVLVMSIQSIVGVVISSCMAGIVFAKLARPKNRSHTVMFSKNAVVTQRNGELYLLFRVGNMRKSHIIEAHVRVALVHQRQTTQEGEHVDYVTEELSVNTEMNMRRNGSVKYNSSGDECSEDDEDEKTEDRAFMMWPFTVAHRIDKRSPLYNLGPKELLASKFEMVVTLEGIVEPTGNSVQARTSYLPNELLWGHRFRNMMSYKKKSGVYMVDFSNLNAVDQDDTPRVSQRCTDDKRRFEAKQSADLRRKISSNSCYLKLGGSIPKIQDFGGGNKLGADSRMSLATQNTSLQSGTDLSSTPSPVGVRTISGGVSMVPNPGGVGGFDHSFESDSSEQSKL